MEAAKTNPLVLFPALKDKCVVRLVSRLQVAKEHTRVQKENAGFLNEIWAQISGKGAQRQISINDNLVLSVEETVEQLANVMESVAIGQRAVAMVFDEVQNIQGHTAVLGSAVLGLKDALSHLEREVNQRFQGLSEAIAEVDYRQRAASQIDRVMRRWETDDWHHIPLAFRAYGTLEELWWGDLGLYVYRFPGEQANLLLQDIQQRLTAVLARAAGCAKTERLDREYWLAYEQKGEGLLIEHDVGSSVAFLADWSNPVDSPFVAALSQPRISTNETLLVPFLISPERLGRELTKEVFTRRVAA